MDRTLHNQVGSLIDQYTDGEISGAEALVKLDMLDKDLKEVREMISEWKSENIEQLAALKDEYPDGYMGMLFEYRSGGVMYNFKKIPEIAEVEQKLKELKDKYKIVAKNYDKGLTTSDENGEILPCPEVSYRKDSIILKPVKR